jgi:hypothetical protein
LKLRRTHLSLGRTLRIHDDDVGRDGCRLLIHGRTESGAEHEIVLLLDSSNLALLVERVRDHFVKLAANEESRRKHRERALRMPVAGGGA